MADSDITEIKYLYISKSPVLHNTIQTKTEEEEAISGVCGNVEYHLTNDYRHPCMDQFLITLPSVLLKNADCFLFCSSLVKQ